MHLLDVGGGDEADGALCLLGGLDLYFPPPAGTGERWRVWVQATYSSSTFSRRRRSWPSVIDISSSDWAS